MHRNTGAVHFTVTANIASDDFVPPSDLQNIWNHIKWIGVGVSAVAGGVTFSGLWVTAITTGMKTAATAVGVFGGVMTTVG